MARWRSLIIGLLLLAGAAGPAGAERLPVRRFTVQDGLPSDRINALLADSRGYLWIGTGDGLSRYDGHRFVNYDEGDGLPGPIVRAIFEARDGSYWVAAEHALCRSQREVDPPASGGAQAPVFSCRDLGGGGAGVNALLEGPAGAIWIGADDGLSRLKPEDLLRDRVPEPTREMLPIPGMVLALAQGRDGDLWLGTSFGLVHRAASGRMTVWRTHRSPEPVYDVRIDRAGRLWACTPHELFRLAPPPGDDDAKQDDRVLEERARDPARTGVMRLAKPASLSALDGFLWEDAGGTMRLLSRDLCAAGEEALQCIPRDRLLPGDGSLRQLAGDRSGALWIGTESSGLLRYSASGFSSFAQQDGLPSLRIRSVFGSPRQDPIVLAGGLDLAAWNGERFEAVRPRLPAIRDPGWGWNQVCLVDHLGGWWIATAQGLAHFVRAVRAGDLGRARPDHVYTTRDGLGSDEIFRVYEDRGGDVWIGVLNGRGRNLHRWRRATGRIEPFVFTGRFEDNAPTAFAEDGSGDLWIGFGDGGLLRRGNDRVDLFPPGGPIPEGRVSVLIADTSGTLWGATTGGGLIRIDDAAAPSPRFSTWTTQQGLSSNRVFCVVDDAQGRIYAGTTRGVDRLDPATGRVRHYTVSDGLPSAEVLLAHRDREGALWFGSLTGLARLRPGADPPAAEAPVLIDQVIVDGAARPLPWLGASEVAGVTIGPPGRRLEIDFVGLSLPAAGELRYQHRLLGASAEWSAPTRDRSVHFSSLPSGTYQFEVRAVTADGNVSSRAAEVSFHVLPPFWRTWWFTLAAALTLTTSAVAVHRQRAARLVEIERVRTLIASDLHDEVGAGLSEIALMSEVWARGGADPGAPIDHVPERIAAGSRRLVDAMSDIVWAINPEKDTVFNLSQRMRRFATTLLRGAGITLTFRSVDEASHRALDGVARRELLLAFQEILTNAVRHARCTGVSVTLDVQGADLVLQVQDDGLGFEPESAADGTGLGSVRGRAARLGGTCGIRTGPGLGTTVTLRVPSSRRTTRLRAGPA